MKNKRLKLAMQTGRKVLLLTVLTHNSMRIGHNSWCNSLHVQNNQNQADNAQTPDQEHQGSEKF